MRCFAALLPLLACAACGSVKTTGELPDAPPAPDAGIDAAARGTVRVTVLDPSGTGAAAVGANVVFVDPDGTLVKRAATDTAGRAEAEVLAGASVTSVVLNDTAYQLQTVLDVAPGDDIVLGVRNPDTTVAGTFTVAFPMLAGATSYAVTSPCITPVVAAPASGAPPPPVTLSFMNHCRQSPMEIVVIPQDANGPMRSLANANINYVNGGSATITGTYQTLRTFTGSYTNIHSMVTSLTMGRQIPDAFGFNDSVSATPTATTVLTLTGPQATGGQIVTQASTMSRSVQAIRQNVSGMAATYGLDLGATLLPWVGTASYDATTRKITVPTDTTGTSSAAPDLVRVAASYRRTDAAQVTTTYAWVVYAPTADSIVLPTLPAELAAINPTATDTVSVGAAILLEADSIASYAAIRDDLNAAFVLYTGSRPPAGTVRFSRGPIVRIPL